MKHVRLVGLRIRDLPNTSLTTELRHWVWSYCNRWAQSWNTRGTQLCSSNTGDVLNLNVLAETYLCDFLAYPLVILVVNTSLQNQNSSRIVTPTVFGPGEYKDCRNRVLLWWQSLFTLWKLLCVCVRVRACAVRLGRAMRAKMN